MATILTKPKLLSPLRKQGRSLLAWLFSGSIQIRLLLVYSGLIVAVLILLNSYPLIMTQNMMFRSKQETLQSQALLLAGTLPVAERLSAESVEQSIVLLEDLRYSRVLVTNEAGLVLYDSATPSHKGRYALTGGLVAALRGSDVFFADYEDGVFYSRAATPVMARGRLVGAVYLYDMDAEQGLLLREVQNNLRAISLAVCILAIVISLLLSRAITGRIATLLAAMRRVREGEYTHRIKLSGRDELSALGEEFNALTIRLQITEEARRRFVSDASHELKTPLASIKLLTDSILQQDMPPDTAREFMTDIDEAADRLIRISEDLLTLNRLDAGVRRRAEALALDEVVENICLLLAPLAQAAQVSIETDLQPCHLSAHEGEVSRIVSNLTENAIKYNNPGGSIFIRTQRDGKSVLLSVEDTGVGIPEEDLPHIFERFYRVDKARSRDAGGTGLGLAIVWETVRVHGGELTAERREGGGMCMRVRFPLSEEAAP